MDAAKLDRLITIERATEARDGFNNVVYGWAPPAWSRTVRASKQDVRDEERIAAQEVGAEITTRFQIRWSSDVAIVNAKYRVVFDGRIYDISGVKEIGRRDGLELTAAARGDK